MKKLILLPVLFLMGTSLPIMAQLAPLVTDRPDQTESSSTVPKKTLQIETGFMHEKYDGDDWEFSGTDIAGTLLRYGLTQSLELRFESGFRSEKFKTNQSETKTDGLAGIGIGAKIKLADEKGPLPEIGVILMADLPVGNFSAEKFSPLVLLAAAHTLSEKFDLGYNLGYELVDGKYGNYLYSVALGMGLTEKLGAYLELYGSADEGFESNLVFDAGLTYLVQENLQLDISAGVGVRDAPIDGFASAGFSWRLPH